jgi:hypothetical protein
MVYGQGVLGPEHLNAELLLSTLMLPPEDDQGQGQGQDNDKDKDNDQDGDSGAGSGAGSGSGAGAGVARQRSVMIPGTFSYVPAIGEALPHAGTHTLRCLFTPADSLNFGSCEVTTTIVVKRARPVVAWGVDYPIGHLISYNNSLVSNPFSSIGGSAIGSVSAIGSAIGSVIGSGSRDLQHGPTEGAEEQEIGRC